MRKNRAKRRDRHNTRPFPYNGIEKPQRRFTNMAENERTPDCENGAALKEAVCIDAMRIYDSCSE
jgi:hypothetical protein